MYRTASGLALLDLRVFIAPKSRASTLNLYPLASASRTCSSSSDGITEKNFNNRILNVRIAFYVMTGNEEKDFPNMPLLNGSDFHMFAPNTVTCSLYMYSTAQK